MQVVHIIQGVQGNLYSSLITKTNNLKGLVTSGPLMGTVQSQFVSSPTVSLTQNLVVLQIPYLQLQDI